MDCKRIEKMLSAYLDQELVGEEYKLVKRHLIKCSRCQEELEKLQAIKNLVGDLNYSSRFNWNYSFDWAAIERKAKTIKKREVVLFSLAAALVAIVLFFVVVQEQAQWEMEVMHPEVLVDLHESLSGNRLDIPLKKETNFIGTLELVSGGK
jgi:predicted anti-sigma-YlaC factor YlaD